MANGQLCKCLTIQDCHDLEVWLNSGEVDDDFRYEELVRATIALRRLLPKEAS